MNTGRTKAKGLRVSTLTLATLTVLAGLIFCGGCANPGPPRPPSLQLPEMVKDLTAQRVGDRVLLRWTTPSRTTDGLDIHSAMTAEICRSARLASAPAKKAPSACTKVRSVTVAAGASLIFDDLPQALLVDPVTLLTYKIQILNGAGRSAGRSIVGAYAAGGAAPPLLGTVTAVATEAGAVLQWQRAGAGEAQAVDLARADLTSAVPSRKPNPPTIILPGRGFKPNIPGKLVQPTDSNEVHLRAAAGKSNGDSAGTVDTTAVMGETYSYVAQRVRPVLVDGHALEIRSLPSPAVTLAMRDTFPPKIPTGLATIPGTTASSHGSPAAGYIDLSWEPNTEPDLAGYLVYRRLARQNGDPQGPLGKLTPSPIAAPAYRDVAVTPGQRYIYSVTAVDASGNESAPSANAQEVAAVQNAGPPQ